MQGVLLHSSRKPSRSGRPSKESRRQRRGREACFTIWTAPGYACLTSNHTLSQLRKGERGKLYTFLNVGESVFDLYGFSSSKELESFRMLLGVSGVGPKAALAILSACTPEALALAVVSGDEKALTAAPGVG